MDKKISEAIDRLIAAAEDHAFCGAARPEDMPLIEAELKDARRELEQLIEQGPRQHVFFETGDPGAPRQILDRNDEVVLALCKVCGQAECELEPTCPGVRHERV